jgi:hypothetical protein
MSGCNILFPCDITTCKFVGERSKWKLHMREHSLGKSYCLACNKFLERLDKHVKTKGHIENEKAICEPPGNNVCIWVRCAFGSGDANFGTAVVTPLPTLPQTIPVRAPLIPSQIHAVPTAPHAHLQPDVRPMIDHNFAHENDIPDNISAPHIDLGVRASAMQYELDAEASLEDTIAYEYDQLAQQLGRSESWREYENAESRAFMYVCRNELHLGPTRIGKLARMIHNPYFDASKIAPTYYLLDRVEQATIPTIVCIACVLQYYLCSPDCY